MEDEKINRRRVALRRVNGGLMFLLAVSFYTLFYASAQVSTQLLLLMAVVVLLVVICILAYLDLRLTRQLRAKLRNPQ